MAFDIEGAKKAGYSDAEIARYLAKQSKFDLDGAKKAGYSDAEVISHLSNGNQSEADNDTSVGSKLKAVGQAFGNLVAGGVRGAGSIGATIMYPLDKAQDLYYGDRNAGIKTLVTGEKPLSRNEERRKAMDDALRTMGAEPDSLLYKTGKIGAEVAGTLPVGGLLGQGAKALGASTPIVNALTTAGMKAGDTPGVLNMLTRIGGGAVTGGVSAGLVNPEDATTGAVIGGALPPTLKVVGGVANAAGRTIKSLVQPLTEKGQQAIATNIVNKFAEGGPTAVNANEIIQGSKPTLAEATGNAGIARLQSAVSDIKPNAFAERQAANAAARSDAFSNVAGSKEQLEFYKAMRGQAADDLYNQALNREPEQLTSYLKGQITQLLKRPSIDEASKTAQRWAIERGEKPAAQGSLRALHDVKTALDDKISEAVRKGAGGEVSALQATKDKLLNVMEKLSPEYSQARVTYAEMSKPINQMETLQGLRLTDAKGNITLGKVQSAIDGLEKLRSAPGVNGAKTLDADQLNTLYSLRDDLLRMGKLNAGKSAGSNTFQNIATDNILSSMLPGKAGELAKQKVGGMVGQVGKLLYSGPNEQIRNRLAEMMLEPTMYTGQAVTQPVLGMNALSKLANSTTPLVYRSAPVLATSR